jgi:hypothetical protein
MTISFRLHLFKYVIIWFIVEATGILAGIGMSGYDDKMQPKWDGYQNIQPVRLMVAHSYAVVVRAWHCKANDFITSYIFKRIPGRKYVQTLCDNRGARTNWIGLHWIGSNPRPVVVVL